jgi:hypothetical protein
MIARTVRLQRPQSDPAPHAMATSLHVDAPHATASATAWLVAPVHRHTNTPTPKQVRLTYVKIHDVTPFVRMTMYTTALH